MNQNDYGLKFVEKKQLVWELGLVVRKWKIVVIL